MLPNLLAGSEESDPRKLPTGVRTALAMSTSLERCLKLNKKCSLSGLISNTIDYKIRVLLGLMMQFL